MAKFSFEIIVSKICLSVIQVGYQTLWIMPNILRAILCKYGASYIGTISRSDSDFDETCWQC